MANDKDIAAVNYSHQKISRQIINKLAQSNIKASSQNGIYAYLLISSLSSSFSFKVCEKQCNLRISVPKIKKLLKVKDSRQLVKILDNLQELDLLVWFRNELSNEICINTILYKNIYKISSQTKAIETASIKEHQGFFLIDKETIERLRNLATHYSDVDIISDMLMSVVYKDSFISYSTDCPVVVFHENTKYDNAVLLQTYANMAARYNTSVGRIYATMKRFESYGFINLRSYQNIGTMIFVPIFLSAFKTAVKAVIQSIKDFKVTLLSTLRLKPFISWKSSRFERNPFTSAFTGEYDPIIMAVEMDRAEHFTQCPFEYEDIEYENDDLPY